MMISKACGGINRLQRKNCRRKGQVESLQSNGTGEKVDGEESRVRPLKQVALVTRLRVLEKRIS